MKYNNVYNKISNIFLVIILIIVSFLAGQSSQKNENNTNYIAQDGDYQVSIDNKYSTTPDGKTIKNVDFNLYWQVWDTVKSTYVDSEDISEEDMFYGSLEGMIKAIDDPYTSFLDPELSKRFNDDLSGSFEGIGAEIGIRDDVLTIIAPINGMPAQEAGLKSGDKVLSIDGKSTAGISIDKAVDTLRGKKGTDVTLTIYREGLDETKDITINRGIITIESVKTEMLENQIMLISISNFNEDTEAIFSKAVEEAKSKEAKGIILDLRNNPGGFLDSAIEIASEWVETGPVVLEKFDENDITKYQARGLARLQDYKTVVLLNQGSASASEIVAGALQDYNKATIVGEQSYGKGSVQSLEPFTDGSSLKVSVAKWLTPQGKSISEKGITPDIEVEYTIEDFENDRDPQLDKAIEIIKNE
ncbi:MAG TPA: S41 family peptidase [Patescibacteria group bacterium]|nr:S41 family peptidase [Patescibacteria group bacterium]